MSFLVHIGDASGLTASDIGELRRAYYAGAAFIIGMIDAAESDEAAAELIVLIKREAHAMADEMNAANDREPGTPAA